MEEKRELKSADIVAPWKLGEKALVPVVIVGGRRMVSCQANIGAFKDNDIKLTGAHGISTVMRSGS
ncbi:hypothetical protein [Mesorhizobium sp. WSM3224]|uniref:hypothetical protein n=1 Tax=Mesorhizobium sp. WSM3224 TaxID=1040986 RepID=UPI00056BCDB1|nr:hypothetical protein [Mesorhizobium sp. WSM3224]